jgi:hypothetical protein
MENGQSISEKILAVFEDGPGMIDDLVLELGMSSNRISGTLNYLINAKKIERKPFHLPPELRKPGKSEVFLYSLRSYRRAA